MSHEESLTIERRDWDCITAAHLSNLADEGWCLSNHHLIFKGDETYNCFVFTREAKNGDT
jgi:hypothetical protein